MSNVAIRVQQVGKQYFIGQGKQVSYDTLGEHIMGIISSPLRSIQSVLQGQSSAVASDNIWALKDVSFDVQHGEVVGIIGRNGAGKSTLLKILSQITEPTEGIIDIYGRVGALLEVGTGFHPELTGRENIYLNGAILGMKRHEIRRKFDEIVDFSGVETFIDTPVKHYSSGMKVRLAFAVAAHLEPEILIVDEVLAVGDAEFQKKCLGKMQDTTSEGRTVLFVSHNMAAISNLCHRAILLENGHLQMSGMTDEVIGTYLHGIRSERTQHAPGIYDVRQRENREKAGRPIIQRIRLENAQGEACDAFKMGEPMQIVVEVDRMDEFPQSRLGIVFYTEGQRLATFGSGMAGGMSASYPRQPHEQVALHIPSLPFTPGMHQIDVSIRIPSYEGILDQIEDAAEFEVVEADVYGNGVRLQRRHGLIYLTGSCDVYPLEEPIAELQDMRVP